MNKSAYQETLEHIDVVNRALSLFSIALIYRGINHDHSKLKEPELTTFIKYTPKLSDSTYRSNEYKQFLKEMKPTLEHHYRENRHHPEHFKNGIDGMNLIDLIEMICDWKAATLRHKDGDIKSSIEKNTKRFKISPQLKQILINTTEIFK